MPPGTRTSLYANPEYADGALRQDDARLRSTRLTRPSRRSSRCPMSACSSSRSPSSRASAPRSASIFSAALAGQTTVDDALAEAQALAARRNDRGRLHQVSCLPAPGRPGRLPGSGPAPAVRPAASVHRSPDGRTGDRPWPPQIHTPAARLMVAPSVILLLIWMIVPLAMTLYFSFRYYNLLIPTAGGWAGLRQLPLLPDRPGLLAGDPQHAAAWSAACWSSPSSAASLIALLIDQPIFGPGDRAHPGDLAVLRHAAGRRAGLEEHVHAPGRTACSPTSPKFFGLQPIDWFAQLPAGLDHRHRRLAVAALRHADPADRAAIASTASRWRRPRWTAPAPVSRFRYLIAAAPGARDHRRHPDPDDLPAGRSSPRSSSPPMAGPATPRPTCPS